MIATKDSDCSEEDGQDIESEVFSADGYNHEEFSSVESERSENSEVSEKYNQDKDLDSLSLHSTLSDTGQMDAKTSNDHSASYLFNQEYGEEKTQETEFEHQKKSNEVNLKQLEKLDNRVRLGLKNEDNEREDKTIKGDSDSPASSPKEPKSDKSNVGMVKNKIEAENISIDTESTNLVPGVKDSEHTKDVFNTKQIEKTKEKEPFQNKKSIQKQHREAERLAKPREISSNQSYLTTKRVLEKQKDPLEIPDALPSETSLEGEAKDMASIIDQNQTKLHISDSFIPSRVSDGREEDVILTSKASSLDFPQEKSEKVQKLPQIKNKQPNYINEVSDMMNYFSQSKSSNKGKRTLRRIVQSKDRVIQKLTSRLSECQRIISLLKKKILVRNKADQNLNLYSENMKLKNRVKELRNSVTCLKTAVNLYEHELKNNISEDYENQTRILKDELNLSKEKLFKERQRVKVMEEENSKRHRAWVEVVQNNRRLKEKLRQVKLNVKSEVVEVSKDVDVQELKRKIETLEKEKILLKKVVRQKEGNISRMRKTHEKNMESSIEENNRLRRDIDELEYILRRERLEMKKIQLRVRDNRVERITN